MKTIEKIVGVSKLNLDVNNLVYLEQCLQRGKTWFVTRSRQNKRCIQASGETKERVQQTFSGWSNYRPSLIEIKDNRVIWHNREY